MATSRTNCLFVLSAAIEGVSAESFIQAFTLAQNNFTVQLASPNGKPIEFIQQDETSRKWLREFRTKSTSLPAKLETIDASRFGYMVIPDSPGSVNDLSHHQHLYTILKHFVEEKKPICAVGMGVAGLCSTRLHDDKWLFHDYSLTSTSVYELARTPYFGSLSLVPEDYIKDNGAKYTSSVSDGVHVVLDRHLVTAQNSTSTYMATQMLLALVNQGQVP